MKKVIPMGTAAQRQTHHASHTVKKLDAGKRMVTFAYRREKSLGWPATTIYGLRPSKWS